MNKAGKFPLFALRVGIAWLFLYAGLSKIFNPEWTAKGYLLAATGPFADLFHLLAGNQIIDILNMWGLTLIGVALALGILLRFASFWGIVLMVLYYLSIYPPKNALIVDDHIIFILVFLTLSGAGSGRFLGFDGYLEEFFAKKGLSQIRFLLG
ncbi:hypothetical protein A3A49_02115 [Candidatus Curtissbacteria bacterium RIFCSPLOWO2_01_FULL_38_11b]|uniref:DoxX family protein n=1 Tax=Candidatus Curtissbacteria bacterium RIFCSPLOWO2_01_FULL_38_11b TaxID=1797725 RepID=A0A1F5H3E6_9BACT|nr:MAG: hypothetical protein A3A49_02115 [Candidatus Curtissbacteria bacterium RIFCSPLOWO2_01_FULL_38_11b]